MPTTATRGQDGEADADAVDARVVKAEAGLGRGFPEARQEAEASGTSSASDSSPPRSRRTSSPVVEPLGLSELGERPEAGPAAGDVCRRQALPHEPDRSPGWRIAVWPSR